MKFMKLHLLIIALLVFVATSAFASLSYDVSVDTTSLNGRNGYLYFQYIPVNAVSSTATVSGFATNGTLGAQDTVDIVNGSAVTGTLPGAVVFANTNGINDYNHAIQFGTTMSFLLSFSNPAPGGQAGGSSTFSLGLFADALGNTPLLNTTGTLGSVPGTLFTVSLYNSGIATTQILAKQATVVPIPAAFSLMGSGLVGLGVIRRRKQK
jgi:hypothetical protein